MEFLPQEIFHYCLRWVYNFHEGDLQKAHQRYSNGAEYHWNKYLTKRKQDVDACQAMTEVVLNMDHEAQTLLVTWIMENNQEEVKEQREWQALSEAHFKKLSN